MKAIKFARGVYDRTREKSSAHSPLHTAQTGPSAPSVHSDEFPPRQLLFGQVCIFVVCSSSLAYPGRISSEEVVVPSSSHLAWGGQSSTVSLSSSKK